MFYTKQMVHDANQVGVVNGEVQPKSAEKNQINHINNSMNDSIQQVYNANQVDVMNGEVQPDSTNPVVLGTTNNPQAKKAEDLFNRGWREHACREYGRAAEYYKLATSLGCTEALYFLALLYYEGKGVEKDLAMSAKCFEVVANAGGYRCEEAKLRLERLADIASGKGIGIIGTDLDEDIAEGTELGPCGDVEEYREMWVLADQGDLEAQRLVAETIFEYLKEYGCPDGDGETMMRYLRNLAEHGDTSAMTMLGEVLWNSQIVGVGIGDVDREEGLNWYRKAAHAGDPIALMELPYLLDDSSKQERDEAFFWKIHHIEDGDSVFGFTLEEVGYPYTDGKGTDWTDEEAFELYTKYAEQGDAISQENLAFFYLDGVCVKENRSEAIKWFTKAAEQGRESAQRMLAELKAAS